MEFTRAAPRSPAIDWRERDRLHPCSLNRLRGVKKRVKRRRSKTRERERRVDRELQTEKSTFPPRLAGAELRHEFSRQAGGSLPEAGDALRGALVRLRQAEAVQGTASSSRPIARCCSLRCLCTAARPPAWPAHQSEGWPRYH
jgi:hypothetical protein